MKILAIYLMNNICEIYSYAVGCSFTQRIKESDLKLLENGLGRQLNALKATSSAMILKKIPISRNKVKISQKARILLKKS